MVAARLDGHVHEACETVAVGDVAVSGVEVDPETQCSHYASERDVVAFEFPCCESFFPCRACHDFCTDHPTERWGRSAFDRRAVLCGVCGDTLSIEAYLAADATCPRCDAAFNPNCVEHFDRYFAVDGD